MQVVVQRNRRTTTFRFGSTRISVNSAYELYRKGVHFGTRFVPGEVMTHVLDFKLSPSQARDRLVNALVSGKAPEVNQLLATNDYVVKMRIPIAELNAAKNVMIVQTDHIRTHYTALQYAQTLLRQLDNWRNGEYFWQLGSPDAGDLDRVISEWKELHKVILEACRRLGLSEQVADDAERNRLAEVWQGRAGERYPAGYFIDLQAVFGWAHETNYEEDDEDAYFDESGVSMYSQMPLSGL